MKIGDDIAMKCFRPVRVKVGHEYRLFRCGKCPYCKMLRSFDLYACNMFEAMSSKSAYSLTLTYAREYVPRMYVQHADSFGEDSFMSFDCSARDDIKEYYERNMSDYLGSFKMDPQLLNQLHNKINSHPTDKYADNVFPYVFVRDIQLFLKRFRKYVKKEFNIETVRYYIVGEYSPLRYRPHWHLHLYFDTKVYGSSVNKAVSTCWKYGGYDLKILQGEFVRYSTKYTTGSMLVPPIFELQSTRPRVLHSRYFGGQVYDGISRAITRNEEHVYVVPDKVSLSCYGELKEYWILRQVENRRFPRCLGYVEKTSRMRRLSYTLYQDAARDFESEVGCPPESLINLADWLNDNLHKYTDLYRWYHRSLYMHRIFYSRQFINGLLQLSKESQDFVSYYKKNGGFCRVHLPSEVQQLYNECYKLITRDSLYRELLVSKKFLTLCKDYNTNVDDYLLDIYNYYNSKGLQMINSALRRMEDVSRTSNAYMLTYYDNIMDEPDYYTIPAYVGYTSYILDLMLCNRKHRELNDANNIFCYDLKDWQDSLTLNIK